MFGVMSLPKGLNIKLQGDKLAQVTSILSEVGFTNDEGLSYHLSSYRSYVKNGHTLVLEYTERFTGVRFYATASLAGKIYSIEVVQHGDTLITSKQIADANFALNELF